MNVKKAYLFILLGLSSIILSACISSKASSVQPITGLSKGTDGYAWWNDAVFYEIFVRSFYDSNGDGIGDINGIIEKLDYLNDGDPKTTTDLGVTGIWLMPINPSATYHGYDPSDYYGINPSYGTMEDFKRLLSECHKRGIRVIIDMVFNHTSNENPWFIQSRDQPESTWRDWYIWSTTNPGYAGPFGEHVWFPTVAGYYYAIFGSGQPDLNYTNPAVSAEIQKVGRFWLSDVGVDGFRLDAVRYLIEDGMDQQDTSATHQWWASFYTMYKQVNPLAMTVAEVAASNYVADSYLKDKEFDQTFDFDLASQILKNIEIRNAVNLNSSIKSSYTVLPHGEYATFLSNHDQERVMSFFKGDVIKAKLAASVLLTTPGTPFVYYGEEIGMTGNKPDEQIRTPMLWSSEKYGGFSTVFPWESTISNYVQTNVATESSDPNSLLALYTSLIQLRNNHAALRVGDYYSVQSDNFSVLSYLRVSKEETLLILINLSEKPVSAFTLSLNQGPLSGKYNAALVFGEGKLKGVSTNSSGGFEAYQPVTEIAANSLMIIQLR